MCHQQPDELMALKFLISLPLGKLSDVREMCVEHEALGFGYRACHPR